MTDQPTYVKLEHSNDWGAVYLRVEGWPLGANLAAQAVKLKTLVRFRWPDGTSACAERGFRRVNTPVSDHGKSYTATADVAVLIVDLHGARLRLDPTTVWISSESFEALPQPPAVNDGEADAMSRVMVGEHG